MNNNLSKAQNYGQNEIEQIKFQIDTAKWMIKFH